MRPRNDRLSAEGYDRRYRDRELVDRILSYFRAERRAMLTVSAAAARVGGGDWIATLPDGLATEVTERGRNLSMGQRQLIALSRVLLQDPSVLILDEATASIDPLTEALVQEGMDELLRERTAMVIAHRLSTIKRADRIVVLRSGAIIEQGTHDRLLEAGGHYAELYNAYFRHQSLEYIQTAPGSDSPIETG